MKVENGRKQYQWHQGSIELVGPHIGHKFQLNLDRFRWILIGELRNWDDREMEAAVGVLHSLKVLFEARLPCFQGVLCLCSK